MLQVLDFDVPSTLLAFDSVLSSYNQPLGSILILLYFFLGHTLLILKTSLLTQLVHLYNQLQSRDDIPEIKVEREGPFTGKSRALICTSKPLDPISPI